MRFRVMMLSALWLAGCMGLRSNRVTVGLTPRCPFGPTSVGTPAWIDANETQLVASYSPKLGDLSGLVVDYAGMPLAGVEVALGPGSVPPGGDTGWRARRTGADGRFRFDSLKPIGYLLKITKPGFDIQWHTYRGITAPVDSICVFMRAAPTYKLEPVSPR